MYLADLLFDKSVEEPDGEEFFDDVGHRANFRVVM
jgi:hypothetical protein